MYTRDNLYLLKPHEILRCACAWPIKFLHRSLCMTGVQWCTYGAAGNLIQKSTNALNVVGAPYFPNIASEVVTERTTCPTYRYNDSTRRQNQSKQVNSQRSTDTWKETTHKCIIQVQLGSWMAVYTSLSVLMCR